MNDVTMQAIAHLGQDKGYQLPAHFENPDYEKVVEAINSAPPRAASKVLSTPDVYLPNRYVTDEQGRVIYFRWQKNDEGNYVDVGVEDNSDLPPNTMRIIPPGEYSGPKRDFTVSCLGMATPIRETEKLFRFDHSTLEFSTHVYLPEHNWGDDWQAICDAYEARNKRLADSKKGGDGEESNASDEYLLQTSEEADILYRAQSDGARAISAKEAKTQGIAPLYTYDDNEKALIYQPLPIRGKKPTHHVRLMVPKDQQLEGLTIEGFLIALTQQQSADSIFAANYIASILLQQPTLQARIDLEDVASKIGYYPEKFNALERNEIRQRIWHYIKFCLCAHIHGARSIPYYDSFDPETKKEIPTKIIGEAIFAKFQGSEQWDLLPLFHDSPPRTVKLILNEEYARLWQLPTVRQYIGGLEMLAKIPCGQVRGAWARSSSIALLHAWRINPKEALAGKITITRRELLTRYAPNTSSVTDILSWPNPIQARKYYREMMIDMATPGFISKKSPEYQEGAENLGNEGIPLPRQGWANKFLDTEVLFIPGESVRADLLLITENKYNRKPRNPRLPPRQKKVEN